MSISSHPWAIGCVCAGAVAVGYSLISVLTMARSRSRLDVKGVHCVVTGGSSGIGLEAAKKLVQEGASVTIIARDQGRIDAALETLHSEIVDPDHQHIAGVSVDVSRDYEEVRKAIEAVHSSAGGQIQVLINCAGYALPQAFDEMDPLDYERMLRVNVVGSMYPTRAVLDCMKQADKGVDTPTTGKRIVFTSSMVGQCSIYGYTAYAASKFALRGLAEALQMEVQGRGIAVSVCYPPDTETPGFEQENKLKSEMCAKLSEAGGKPFSARQVAKDLVSGMKRGDFAISSGLDGKFLALGTAGFAPVFSRGEACLQVLLASFLRLIFIVYNWDFYRRVARSQAVAPIAEGSQEKKES